MSRRHSSSSDVATQSANSLARVAAIPMAILMSLALLAGCGGGGEAPQEERPAAGAEEDVSPLSREQLELQAEAMSPEVAESLGIVDTTIRVTRPIPPDSALLPGTGFDTFPDD